MYLFSYSKMVNLRLLLIISKQLSLCYHFVRLVRLACIRNWLNRWRLVVVAACSERTRIAGERSQNDGTAGSIRDASTKAQGIVYVCIIRPRRSRSLAAYSRRPVAKGGSDRSNDSPSIIRPGPLFEVYIFVSYWIFLCLNYGCLHKLRFVVLCFFLT